MKRIHVDGTRFVNEDGNTVIFNGINIVCKQKELGYLFADMETLFRAYANKGFNLIRLGIFWDGVEPNPGQYDTAYIGRVRQAVETAEAAGLYIMLDMHQDLFSALYADGAPAWATITDGAQHPAHCRMWYEAYLQSDAIINAADHFWKNDPAEDGVGLIDHYAAMWRYLATEFSGHRNVIGLEPMNEPFMGSIARNAFGKATVAVKEQYPEFDLATQTGVNAETQGIFTGIVSQDLMAFDRQTLMPFYNTINAEIRKVCDIAIVTDGNIYCSAFFPSGITRVTAPDGTPETQQIYSPHGYDTVVDTDHFDKFNIHNVTALFADKRRTQTENSFPVIVGEWGAFPSKGFTNRLIEHMNGILEEYLWSSTYWAHIPGLESDANYASLDRGYPTETCGALVSYTYDHEAKSLDVCWNGPWVLCWFPQSVTKVSNPDVSYTVLQSAGNGCFVKLENRKGGKVSAAIL